MRTIREYAIVSEDGSITSIGPGCAGVPVLELPDDVHRWPDKYRAEPCEIVIGERESTLVDADEKAVRIPVTVPGVRLVERPNWEEPPPREADPPPPGQKEKGVS